MFSPEDIKSRLRQQPFRPFRIIASEGQKFDVRHPDLVFVGSRDIMVGFPAPNNPTIYDGVTRLALIHILALEDIPVPASSSDGHN